MTSRAKTVDTGTLKTMGKQNRLGKGRKWFITSNQAPAVKGKMHREHINFVNHKTGGEAHGSLGLKFSK